MSITTLSESRQKANSIPQREQRKKSKGRPSISFSCAASVNSPPQLMILSSTSLMQHPDPSTLFRILLFEKTPSPVTARLQV